MLTHSRKITWSIKNLFLVLNVLENGSVLTTMFKGIYFPYFFSAHEKLGSLKELCGTEPEDKESLCDSLNYWKALRSFAERT